MADTTHTGSGDWQRGEPSALVALAIALRQLVGPGPDLAAGWTELNVWHDRYSRAAEIVAEVANRDGRLLRSLAGPYDDDAGNRPPGRDLLSFAALRIDMGR